MYMCVRRDRYATVTITIYVFFFCYTDCSAEVRILCFRRSQFYYTQTIYLVESVKVQLQLIALK